MKKKNFLLVLACTVFSIGSANAQVSETPVCYDASETEQVDFWLDHFYYAKCTDYSDKTASGGHAGGYVFEANTNYIGLAAWGGLDWDGIRVSQDGTYRVQIVYGIGYCDDQGAWANLQVNGELMDQLIFFVPEPSPGTIEIEAELYANYDNIIQLISVKDWPVFLGIQIFPLEDTGISTPQESSYTVSCIDGTLVVNDLTGINDRISIYTPDGKLINSITSNTSSSYSTSLAAGMYIINVNGCASKILVK